MDTFQNLAHAVVVQAVKDWTEASRHPRSDKSKDTREECEKFFLSDWFVQLSGLDGKAFLARLRKERISK